MLNPADPNLEEAAAEADVEAPPGQAGTATGAPEDAAPATGGLAEADRDPAAGSWLALVCGTIEGVSGGIVLRPPGNGGGKRWRPAALWPASRGDITGLVEAADAAAEQGRTVVRPHADDADGETHDLAHPIHVGDAITSIVALEVGSCPQDRLPAVVGQLRARSDDLVELLDRATERRPRAAGGALESALWLVAICLEHERFRGAATAVATEMAAQFDCDRVSIGSVDKEKVEVQALSHSADFADEMNLIRRIGAAMDEAVDQRSSVVAPSTEEIPLVGSRAHEELLREEDPDFACTVLLGWNDEIVGAVTLERSGERPFTPAEVETLEDTAALLGPILELKRRDDRWLHEKAWDSCRSFLANLVGAGHVGLKLAAAAVVAALLLASVATGTFRVSAPAALEGAVVRAAVAPIDGYIAEAPVRAGEVVDAGDVLAVLDDRVLRLEQRSWQSQRDQIESEYLEAMAEQERVKMSLLRANMEQAQVQLDLIAEQLARLRIAAPIDGIVVSGDLSQSIGAPVEQGEILFEVAPLDSYRLMLRVDERDISYVRVGQKGRVVLAALPETGQPFTVERVTPVSTSEEGTNFFLVEARLDEASPQLRPGMEGIGKVEIGEARWIWIVTRRISAWLRLWFWSWGGG